MSRRNDRDAPIAASASLRNAKVYRGWRYVVFQRGRHEWDVEQDPPGDRLASSFRFGNPWTAGNGEGEFFGNEIPGYDPGWHLPDRVYPCPSCGGTGNRSDQRYM